MDEQTRQFTTDPTLAARALETRPMSEKIDRLLAEVVELTERSRDYDRSLARVQKDAIRRYDDADERIQRLEERALRSAPSVRPLRSARVARYER